MDEFLRYTWMGNKIGNPIHVWQARANGTKNVIGEITNPIRTGNNVEFTLKCQNPIYKKILEGRGRSSLETHTHTHTHFLHTPAFRTHSSMRTARGARSPRTLRCANVDLAA